MPKYWSATIRRCGRTVKFSHDVAKKQFISALSHQEDNLMLAPAYCLACSALSPPAHMKAWKNQYDYQIKISARASHEFEWREDRWPFLRVLFAIWVSYLLLQGILLGPFKKIPLWWKLRMWHVFEYYTPEGVYQIFFYLPERSKPEFACQLKTVWNKAISFIFWILI